ncbi:MAG: isoaspartyl peptidase/L-asparaginase [Desulfobacterium sp.]|nr:isoaspartyl peptidase/L-asparaginase [Desulfobacterium sp.]
MSNFQRAILPHGGAGSDPKDFDGPESAASKGIDLMANGETALSAVVDAVKYLEDEKQHES